MSTAEEGVTIVWTLRPPVFPLLHPTPVSAILRNELNAGRVRLLNYARKDGVRAGAMGRLYREPNRYFAKILFANPIYDNGRIHVVAQNRKSAI